MKNNKLVQRIVPVISIISVFGMLGGCATTDDLYAEYDAVCELPKPEQVERIKIVKEVVEKERIVEKVKVVEKIKPVETIKYVDRVKVVEKPTTVYKTRLVQQPMPGVVWEPAVYFGYDLASLTSSETARLDRDLLALKTHPTLKISIQAFTDSKGSAEYNRDLALRRQATVLDYLLSNGLQRERILMSPLGEELPILGESVQERTINRRVELMLLDAKGRPLSLAIQPKSTAFVAPAPVK